MSTGRYTTIVHNGRAYVERAELEEAEQSAATLSLIVEHGLLVRPSLIPGQWRAGQWRGVNAAVMGAAYCHDGTEWEGETIAEAVRLCVDGLRAHRQNPDYLKAVQS